MRPGRSGRPPRTPGTPVGPRSASSCPRRRGAAPAGAGQAGRGPAVGPGRLGRALRQAVAEGLVCPNSSQRSRRALSILIVSKRSPRGRPAVEDFLQSVTAQPVGSKRSDVTRPGGVPSANAPAASHPGRPGRPDGGVWRPAGCDRAAGGAAEHDCQRRRGDHGRRGLRGPRRPSRPGAVPGAAVAGRRGPGGRRDGAGRGLPAVQDTDRRDLPQPPARLGRAVLHRPPSPGRP